MKILPSGTKLNNTLEELPPQTPAGGSGAPTNATYVVITNDATLTQERALAVTGALTLTDGGANSTVTLNGQTAGQSGSGFNWGKYIAGRSVWPLG